MPPVSPSPANRRSVLKAATWTVPAVAVASAAPAFAASTTPAIPEGGVVWGDSSATLASIGLLNDRTSGGSLANVSVLPIGANDFTITNTGSAPLTDVTAQVIIEYAGGLPLLVCKGYGVYAVHGDPARVTNRTETYAGIGLAGTYETTQTLILNDVPAGQPLQVPITFGLTSKGALGISVLVTYRVSMVVYSGSTQIGDVVTTTLTLPVGIDLL